MILDSSELYPLLFAPIYKARMWGGDQLHGTLNRILPKSNEPIGESWELVDREDEQSVVANGKLKGKTLNELVSNFGKDLVGKNYHGGRFPILVKIIDAGMRLSLQVHPDAEACARLGKGAEPKTEMWYIISAKRGAKIMAGLNPKSTKRQLLEALHSPEIENQLQVFNSEPGDAYFISSGTIHAIGGGNLLLEIQQNSDTTFRVSDWGRVDSEGKPREIHIDNALESINFTNRTSPRISGVADAVNHNRKFPVVNRCQFFKVDDLRLVSAWRDTTTQSGSFHLISAVNNAVTVGGRDIMIELKQGESCLIPACFGDYSIIPKDNSETTVVKTTL
jgi:mannose-6-phosphate isomerase